MDALEERRGTLISLYKTARRARYANLVGLLAFSGLSLASLFIYGRGVAVRLLAPGLVIALVFLVRFWNRFRQADDEASEAERNLGAFLAEVEGGRVTSARPRR